MTISRRFGNRRAGARIAPLAVAVLAVVALVAGCSSTVTGTPIAQQGTVPATGSTDDTTTPFSLPTATGSAPGGDISIDVEIGDCVRLGGTTDDATIDTATCGSQESNYRVVASELTTDFCPSDVDQTYYETLDGIEQGALCLDIDFVVGGCMDLGTPDPERADCSASMIQGVRVAEILQGTVDESECSTRSGYVYDERQFVVCLESL